MAEESDSAFIHKNLSESDGVICRPEAIGRDRPLLEGWISTFGKAQSGGIMHSGQLEKRKGFTFIILFHTEAVREACHSFVLHHFSP